MGSTGEPNDGPDSVESPHPPGEDARPEEVGHKDPSAEPRGLTPPPEYIPATTKLPPGQGHAVNLLSRPPSLSGDSKTLTEIPAQGATEVLNAPPNLEWRREYQARTYSFRREGQKEDTVRYLCASPRFGQPLENGQPPPRIRGPMSRRRGAPPNVLRPLSPKRENFNASSPGPVPVQPVPMGRHIEDGLRMRVAGDEPQREKRIQPEGGDFVSVMSSSPFVSGDVADARTLPTQPLSTSISPPPDTETGHPTVDEGKAQQRTGSGDMANGSGNDGARHENSRKPSAQSQPTEVTSPVYPYPEQERDDDKNPPPFKLGRPLSRGNSDEWPSRAVERDKPTHPGAAHRRTRSEPPPPTTKRGRINQPMHTIPLLKNTMRPGVTAVGRPRRGTYYGKKANQLPPPPPEVTQDGSSSNFCCCCIC